MSFGWLILALICLFFLIWIAKWAERHSYTPSWLHKLILACKHKQLSTTDSVAQTKNLDIAEALHATNAELRLEIKRRNKAEKELIRARKEAEDANRSKTRFLALASHDVLQPLNAAKLYLSALQESDLPDETHNIALKLNDSIVASEALIATILDISRLEQGQLKPYIETINTKDAIIPIINEMSMKAKEKGLELKYRIHDSWISTDRTLFYRVIQNLISNAIKYTENGKVLVTVRKQRGNVLVQVRDTGIGIPKPQLAAIFSEFYRIENNTEKGLGLGLSVVKKLASQLDCSVKVESEETKGSTFTISIKQVDSPEQYQVLRSAINSAISGLRILCIDDQTENLDAMSTLLKKWGVEVSTAHNDQSALKTAKLFCPHILLVDYQLGRGLNGLEIIEQIRQQSKAILPACLVTARMDDTLIADCRDNGVNYLNKPLQPAKLRTLIQSMAKYVKRTKPKA